MGKDMFDSDPPAEYPSVVAEVFSYSDYNPPSRRNASMTKQPSIDFKIPVPFGELPTFTNADGKLVRRFSWEFECHCYGDTLDVIAVADGKTIRRKNYDIDEEAEGLPNENHPSFQSAAPSRVGTPGLRSDLGVDGTETAPPPSYTQTIAENPAPPLSLTLRRLSLSGSGARERVAA